MNTEFDNNETKGGALLHAQNPVPDFESAAITPTPSVKQKAHSKEPPVLSKADQDDFKKLDKKVREGIDVPMRTGECLLEIKERKLYKAKHKTWKPYCEDLVGMTPEHANRLIRAARHASLIKDAVKDMPHPGNIFPTVEWQVRPLYKLGDMETVIEAWTRAVEIANGSPTAGNVQKAVDEILGPIPVLTKEKMDKKEEYREILDALGDCIRLRNSWEESAELVSRLRDLLKLGEVLD